MKEEKDYIDADEVGEETQGGAQTAMVHATPLAMQVQTEMTPDDLRAEIAKQTEMRSILVDYVKSQMKAEHHYYSFNAGDKPVLTQDGAYLINGLFKAIPGPVKTTIERDEDGHFTVYAEATLVNQNGMQIATGDGMCSTRESKYAFRKGERTCPNCGTPAIIKGRAEYGGGWVCFAKKNGCGSKFQDGDPLIENQQVGRVDNPDIADLENTVLKMACKRASVAATRKLPLVSELFTQDLGDDDERHPQPKPRRSAGNGSTPPSAPTHTGTPKSVDTAVILAKKLVTDFGCTPEDLQGMFLPNGVKKFSDLSEDQAKAIIPGLSELLNSKISEAKTADI